MCSGEPYVVPRIPLRPTANEASLLAFVLSLWPKPKIFRIRFRYILLSVFVRLCQNSILNKEKNYSTKTYGIRIFLENIIWRGIII